MTGAPRDAGVAAPRRGRRPLWKTLAAVLVVALPFVPSFWWSRTPPREIGVVIVDKTLPHARWREHEWLHFWLEQRRVRGPGGDVAWDVARDYVGFDPAVRRGTDLDSTHLAAADVVYVADAYGVYAGDFRTDSTEGLEPSAKLYGGMALPEVEALERHVARGGHVVAEFNTLEDPTAGTPAGDRLGRLLGANFQHWLGRWYRDLAAVDEIPTWMRERYERVYWRPWEFTGPGLVVISDRDDRIVVIPAAEFTQRLPVTVEVLEPSDPLMRGVQGGEPHWFWFSATQPSDSARVLAEFRLHVNADAAKRLGAMGFSTTLPAVVRHTGAGVRAYFAGDFADVGAPPPAMRTRGLDWLGRFNARKIREGSQRRLWWRFVLPLWDNVLAEVEAAPTGSAAAP